jgi:hypothetical protein
VELLRDCDLGSSGGEGLERSFLDTGDRDTRSRHLGQILFETGRRNRRLDLLEENLDLLTRLHVLDVAGVGGGEGQDDGTVLVLTPDDDVMLPLTVGLHHDYSCVEHLHDYRPVLLIMAAPMSHRKKAKHATMKTQQPKEVRPHPKL